MWGRVVGAVGLVAAGAVMTDASAAAVREITLSIPAHVEFFDSNARETALSSSTGEGKTFVLCLDAYRRCWEVAGLHAALTRLERASMTETTLKTLKEKVADPAHVAQCWHEKESALAFPNGSRISVFGWLDEGRPLSAEYGYIGVDQAEQLSEKHLTAMATRARRGGFVLKRPDWPPLIKMVFNPEDPEHWANRRYQFATLGNHVERNERGDEMKRVIIIPPRANIAFNGPEYYELLETYKGTVWYDRLVLGLWTRAAGSPFPMWDGSHVVDAPAAWSAWGGYPPPDWPRMRGIDFGYRNPFACLTWAESPDGERYLYRQRYRSGRTVEQHAADIVADEARELTALRASATTEQARDLAPYLETLNVTVSYADPADPEGIATLNAHGVWCAAGKNDIEAGVRHVVRLLNERRILVVRGSLVEPDRNLEVVGKPTCLEQEMPRQRYQERSATAQPNDTRRELLVDADNHAYKTLHYLWLTVDTTDSMGVM